MAHRLERWHVAATGVVLLLATGASLLGLVRPGHYRAPPELVESYRMQDLAILVVGVPVLALGLRYALRDSPRGRILWLGGLAYMTYVWASIAVQIPFNDLFLVYVGLFGLSLFTFVGGMVATDAGAIRRTLAGRLDTRVYSAALVVVGLGLGALWLSDILPALSSATTPALVTEVGPQALVSHVLDLGVVVPSILLSAWWLIRERPWGYVFAGVELVLGATLAAPIAITTLVFLTGDTVTVSPIALVFTVLPLFAAVVLAVTYLRAMAAPAGPASDCDRRQSV